MENDKAEIEFSSAVDILVAAINRLENRVRAQDAVILAQQEGLRLANEVLKGHQAILEAKRASKPAEVAVPLTVN